MLPIARLYRDSQSSIVELFRSLDADDWATPVPCAPEWTVRDVLSHLVGVTDDIANRRLEGSGTDPWTASQVERWRDADPAQMIEHWNCQIGDVADALELFGEARPAFDAHMHEHDIRHALGRPGERSSEVIDLTIEAFAGASCGRPVDVAFDDGSATALPGEGDPIAVGGLSRYEFVRSRLGRRTPEQVRAYDWSATPDDELLGRWFIFGPSPHPITE